MPGQDLHAGDFNTPEALERRHPVLQSDEKWGLSSTLARYSSYLVLEGEVGETSV